MWQRIKLSLISLTIKITGLVFTPLMNLFGILVRKEKKLLLKHLKLRPTDIFIASYPKAGTTITQYIVYLLVSNKTVDDLTHIMSYSIHAEEYPKLIGTIQDPRVIKTHCQPNELPISDVAKYIYVYRDGLDTAVSYYDHYVNLNYDRRDFPTFFNSFMKGEVMYGQWFEHLESWSSIKKNKNVLFINFDTIVNSPKESVITIAKFLNIDVSQSRLNEIVEAISFEKMKRNEEKFSLKSFHPKMVGSKKSGDFLNSGVSGRGLKLSEEYINNFRKKLETSESIVNLFTK